MTSKEEKLAAARRKLKEFQGKNKIGDKPKNVENLLQRNSPLLAKDFSHAPSEPSPYYTPISKDSRSDGESNPGLGIEGNHPQSVPFFKKSQLSESQESKKLISVDLLEKSAEKEEVRPDLFRPPSSDFFNKIDSKNNSGKADTNFIDGERSRQHISENSFGNVTSLSNGERSLDLHSKHSVTDSALNDIVKPLQLELQNHAQTISILVQQRNEAQTAVAHAQNLLAEKSEEVEKLNRHIASLTLSIDNLNERLLDAEKIIEKLKFEKEKDYQRSEDEKRQTEALEARYSALEEEYLEMKRKFEEKNRECQTLTFNLNDVQSQLSLCQIQLQQFSSSGDSTLTIQVSQLRDENESLRKQIEDLKKQIEVTNSELEQSSQNFHIYAQQCNSQLSNLNSQVTTLKVENQKLVEENAMLKQTSPDSETEKKTETICQRCSADGTDLSGRVSTLTEDNDELKKKLHDKEEELLALQKEIEEKNVALKNLENILKVVETENKKLTIEAEAPKANERLLAIMESDKVAAAKAVSQNLKLKEQVGELETAFMKLSQEKLELTDQLAHEKHVTAELQKQIKNMKSDNCDDHNHKHHHHHSDGHESDDCHHHEKEEPLVNDSNEIEELRSIVRQLQDDKIELKARLNSLCQEGKVTKEKRPEEENNVQNMNHETEDEKQCENTKALLQMMEEKVRKTMNEIALLDEEKEKLEHLVLQLQGETETIGEYITLYQKQRMLLRQRAQEKDVQLMQLSKDKEELRRKLASLDELVKHLLAEKQNASIYSEPNSAPSVASEKTADKIRDLISEIGSTRLIDSNSVAFEHCSCCSGRLITV